MNILTMEAVQKSMGNTLLFRDVNLGMEDHDRIGVAGVNGTGKSTLLSVAGGLTEPDAGLVTRRSGLRISYLPQNPVFRKDRTVLENVAFAIRQDEEYWNVEGEARAVLRRLGIPDPDCLPGILSGGQRKRAALAAAMLTPSDLLILDEPTNHLDHDMIEWLEGRLRAYRGALLMVTHDRYFLDEVTSVIWEIDRTRVYSYPGNYEKYLEMKQSRMDFTLAAERRMASMYRQDLAWMMRGARARSTKQKAHIRRFEELRDREKIVEDRNVTLASLPSRMGNTTIEAEDLSKQYGDRVLFRNFTYTFLKHDRIGIIGPNGCGKSTLLKILMGKVQPDTGRVTIGQTIRTGYFGQENEALPENDRVIDYVKDTAEYIQTPDGTVTASAMCERFLFDAEKQYAPVGKLSGGEKRRLYLLHILMESPNVLMLDEPTNDLDIPTLQILEDYLDHFAGIVIAVSHDRYFLDRVVNRIFSFEDDGLLHQSEGGYEEYRERRLAGMDSSRKPGTDPAPGRDKSRPGQTPGRDGQKSGGGTAQKAGERRPSRPRKKLTFSEQREYETLEGTIDALTELSSELERQMLEAASDYVRLRELNEKKEAADRELDEKIERFLELQDLVDSFG